MMRVSRNPLAIGAVVLQSVACDADGGWLDIRCHATGDEGRCWRMVKEEDPTKFEWCKEREPHLPVNLTTQPPI